MMKRWGWNQTYGGDRSSRIIRAPEHQAAMAHAAGVMAAFAEHLKKPQSEVAKWREVVDRHVKLTASLYRSEENCHSYGKEWRIGAIITTCRLVPPHLCNVVTDECQPAPS